MILSVNVAVVFPFPILIYNSSKLEHLVSANIFSVFSGVKNSLKEILRLRNSALISSSPFFKYSSLSILLKNALILFLAYCVYAMFIHSLEGIALLFVLILIISPSFNT